MSLLMAEKGGRETERLELSFSFAGTLHRNAASPNWWPVWSLKTGRTVKASTRIRGPKLFLVPQGRALLWPGRASCGQQRLLNAAALDTALSRSLNGTCCLNTLSFLKCSFGARVISRSHLCEAGLQHSAGWVFAQAPALPPLWAEVPFSGVSKWVYCGHY